MKRKWKDRFIKRGLAWMLCILLVMQLVGANSLTAMADKAREILTAEAQKSTGEEFTTEKAKSAEETTTEKATVEENATEKETTSEKITTEKESATEDTTQPEKEITTEKETAAENSSSTETNSSEDKNASEEGITAEENGTVTTENASTETASEEGNAGAAGTETNPGNPIGFDSIGSKINAGIALMAAGEPVKYYDPTSGETKTAEGAIEVSSDETIWTAGWYVVKEDQQLGLITVNENVNLILADGATLYATRGITVSGDSSLTIWGQQGGSGALKASGSQGGAGIGGQSGQSSGSITIYGGNITANGGNNAAGIGGGLRGNGENIAIHGGTVQATGASQGAGIGGGFEGSGNNITITGGVVTAQGGSTAAGIGGGAFSRSNGTVTITGGTVLATAGTGYANGIGGGTNTNSTDVMSSGTTMISGGIVTAKAGNTSSRAIGSATIDGNYIHMTYGNEDGLDETETPVEWTGGGSLYGMSWVKIQPMVPKELSIEEENVEVELTGNQDGAQIQLHMTVTAEVAGKEISTSPIWSDDSNDSRAEGDTIYIYDSESNPKITFTATWGDKTDSVTVTVIQPKVTVSFDTLGNGLVENQIISRLDKIAEPEIPKHDGYYVEGWYTGYDKYDEGEEYWYNLWDFEQPVTSDSDIKLNGDGTLSLTLYAKWVEKEAQQSPSGLTGGIRTITGTTSAMEYAESPNANEWTPCTDEKTTVEPGTWYVRYAETDTSNASKSVSVKVTDKLIGEGTVTVADIVYGEEPNPIIESKTHETDDAITEYKKQGADDSTYTETKPTMPGDYTVRVTFPETETSTKATATADFTIRKAEQQPPSGLTGSVKIITGTTSAMEYAASENADKWTACGEGETKADPGTWYVRYAETDTLKASASVSVKVTDKLVGKGTVTVADIVYGETPNPVIESETNGTKQAVLEYKKQDAKDKDYSKTVPKNAGKYRVRVTFPETETYMETVATADFTIKKAAGSGTVTANDYYYGGSMTPRLESETNGIKEAVVEYKKAAEPDAKYSKEIPEKPGSYAVRATFPANDNYTKAEDTDEFTISYLPTPEKPYSLKGTKGENNYYISDVTITAAKGYLVCANPDGRYEESLTITESKEAGKLYFMKEKTGEKTDEVDFGAVLIDKEAPVIDAEEGKTYYGEKAAVTVRDANLQSVVVNGKEEESDGESVTLSLSAEAGATEYELLARDVAGNESRIKITVAAEWIRSGVVPAGTAVKLLRQNPYTLSGGSWQTDGDSTTYTGGRTFYVREEGNYTFYKK